MNDTVIGCGDLVIGELSPLSWLGPEAMASAAYETGPSAHPTEMVLRRFDERGQCLGKGKKCTTLEEPTWG